MLARALLAALLALALVVPSSSLGAPFASTAQNTLGCAGQSILNTTFTPINLTADTQLITGSTGLRIYLCHVDLVVSASDNVSLVEGTGSVCGTGTAGLYGGATAATGWNLGANGTLAFGDGNHVIGMTATAGDNLCLLRSSGAQVSGSLVWAQF